MMTRKDFTKLAAAIALLSNEQEPACNMTRSALEQEVTKLRAVLDDIIKQVQS